MITIIDYECGNLKSIRNGFTHIGVEVSISNDICDLEKADALVLPGVGAFGNAMKNIRTLPKRLYMSISMMENRF